MYVCMYVVFVSAIVPDAGGGGGAGRGYRSGQFPRITVQLVVIFIWVVSGRVPAACQRQCDVLCTCVLPLPNAALNVRFFVL